MEYLLKFLCYRPNTNFNIVENSKKLMFRIANLILPWFAFLLTIIKTQTWQATTIRHLYNGHHTTIQWSLHNHTMVIIQPYYGHCITIQWSSYTHTMVIIYPYNGHCTAYKGHCTPYKGHHTTIQWSLYNYTMAISRRVFCNSMPLMPCG